jgi:hypothetical protein
MAEEKKKEKKILNKQEREDLRRINKRRFTVLRQQLAQREMEISDQIRSEIVAEKEGDVREFNQRAKSLEDRRNELMREVRDLEAEASTKGIVILGNIDHGNMRAEVSNINGLVRERLVAVRKAAGAHNVSLHEQELEFDEKILLSGIVSTEALDLLAQIPTVDKLFPLPSAEQMKAIDASTEAREEV